jgi:hypothetical protein
LNSGAIIISAQAVYTLRLAAQAVHAPASGSTTASATLNPSSRIDRLARIFFTSYSL